MIVIITHKRRIMVPGRRARHHIGGDKRRFYYILYIIYYYIISRQWRFFFFFFFIYLFSRSAFAACMSLLCIAAQALCRRNRSGGSRVYIIHISSRFRRLTCITAVHTHTHSGFSYCVVEK